ncbi:MAG: hypothetical protein P1S60_13835 [Anaerolineae bacterium]|nr:hypothetical protein [Anaerolineae bacterium]
MQNKGTMWRTVLLLALAVMIFGLGACAGTQEPAMDDTVDGEAMLQESCTKCHDLERVTSKAWDATRWEQVVDHMIEKGAQVSDKEALVTYLAETYGP